MVRVQFGVGLLVVFALLGATVFSNVSSTVAKSATQTLDSNLALGRQSIVHRRNLRDYAVLARARTVASTPKLSELLKAEPVGTDDKPPTAEERDDFAYSIHQQMYEEVLVWATRFKAQEKRKLSDGDLSNWMAEPPAWLMVVDRHGIGVADANDAARYGPKTANILGGHPSLAMALKDGKSFRDIWLIRGAPMTMGVVPVKADGAIVGAVIVGYRLTDAAAKQDGSLAQAHVAYAIGGRVSQSSSLPSASEGQLEAKLAEVLKGSGTDSGLFNVDLERVRYRAVWRKLRGYASADAAVVVLKDADDAMRSAQSGLFIIPLSILLGGLFSIGFVLLIFGRHMRAFSAIDQGVMEIINGNLDYWFEGRDNEMADTMAQNLNIMVCHLSGRPLPAEEDDEIHTENWVTDKLFVDAIDAAELSGATNPSETMETTELASISPETVRLVRDDAATYHQRTYEKYVRALEQTGESTKGLNLEVFVKQLDVHAETLRQQYQCKRVRFLVEIEDGKAVLKPVPMD